MSKNKFFDASEIFDNEIAPIGDQLMKACEKHDIALVYVITHAHKDMKEASRFAVACSVLGSIDQMPTEQIIAAALINDEFREYIKGIHTEYMAWYFLEGQFSDDNVPPPSHRAAIAYVAVEGILQRADEKMAHDLNSVRRMVSIFNPMNFIDSMEKTYGK